MAIDCRAAESTLRVPGADDPNVNGTASSGRDVGRRSPEIVWPLPSKSPSAGFLSVETPSRLKGSAMDADTRRGAAGVEGAAPSLTAIVRGWYGVKSSTTAPLDTGSGPIASSAALM